MKEPNLPSQPILGLIDGIKVLQYLATANNEMSGLAIAQELGIEKTKVNRILKTLNFLGLIYNTKSRKYSLGPAVHVLSAQMLYGSGLIKHSLGSLIELTELNVIVAMGVLWKDKVSYLYHWEPGISGTDGLGRINIFPATQSSIGLILLAEKSDEEIAESIGKENIPGFNSYEDLMVAVERIRQYKYASTIFEGRLSIAVKIGTPAYAAIALASDQLDLLDDKYLQILNEKVKVIDKFQNLK